MSTRRRLPERYLCEIFEAPREVDEVFGTLAHQQHIRAALRLRSFGRLFTDDEQLIFAPVIVNNL